MDFDTRLQAFVDGCGKLVADKNPVLHRTLSVTMGRRFAKIVSTGNYKADQMVYCFVDRTNGDVLKAASWKAPAMHARGNIYNDDNGLSGMTRYGAYYLRS